MLGKTRVRESLFCWMKSSADACTSLVAVYSLRENISLRVPVNAITPSTDFRMFFFGGGGEKAPYFIIALIVFEYSFI